MRLEFRKFRKVPISCPKFGHSVVQTEGSDSSIMDTSSRNLRMDTQLPESLQIPWAFVKKAKGTGILPTLDGFESHLLGSRRAVDPRMGYDGQELMNGAGIISRRTPAPMLARIRRHRRSS